MSLTVSAQNEENVMYLSLQALGPQLPKHTAVEAARSIRKQVVSPKDLQAAKRAQYAKRLDKLFANQGRGECITEGNKLLWDILNIPQGSPHYWKTELLFARIRRTVSKQLWKSVAGIKSQSSVRAQYQKAKDLGGSVYAANDILREAEEKANGPHKVHNWTEVRRRALTDNLSNVDREDIVDEAMGLVLSFVASQCSYPQRSFLGSIKGQVHKVMQVYLRRQVWNTAGLSEEVEYGSTQTDFEGNQYQAFVPFTRSEECRIRDILTVAEETCITVKASDRQTVRALRYIEAAFKGEEVEYSNRMLKSRDLAFVRDLAKANPALRNVLYATG